MVSSVLAFNLGIEVMQLLVIGVTMPWLLLLARTRSYPSFRIIAASITGIAALGWIAERGLGWNNPVAPLVEMAAAHALWACGGTGGVVRKHGALRATSPNTEHCS